ncbi:uncharacterized protein LOC135071214 isoform X1 [Ostrinia nubilalis]|uniref:uncharacterized protein LOC135071214 isoform X1 n=1 Tax=Ostrinia nubilalis TaxID=29057 RepID=UPI003082568E
MPWVPALLLVAIATGAHAQSTGQTSVAPDLRECYTNPWLLNRNNLPPTTIQTLIDIIRQIEDNPNVNVDMRTMAALLLHTYRQDGIEYHSRDGVASANVLPFSPTFHSFHRHRLLLRMIPSNLQALPNNTLSAPLKCALHHMLSTTVDARLRGDESSCGQLSQYRALRTSRSVRSVKDDVELLDVSKLRGRNGQMRQYNPNDDVESTGSFGPKRARQLMGDSACPILTGVVKTKWGDVSVGNLIAGIAAGTESQQVPITELIRGSTLNYQNVQTTLTSIFPATLSGDLAEAVLIQGTRGSQIISVGTAGHWNSTQAQRFFMLSERSNVEMTDPEIRGGIDGFVLGNSSAEGLRIYSSLRLSQLLDMYFAPRNGFFNTNLRACNRRNLSLTHINNDALASETRAFTAALDSIMPLEGTLTGGLEGLVQSAITNYQTYTSNTMNDLNCIITEATSPDFRLRTNLYIVLDSSWPYNTIYPAISYLLEAIEVNKYGSSVTLLSAADGRVLINQTLSQSEFHLLYNATTHQSFPTGVNLETSLPNIRQLLLDTLRNESSSNFVGGNSSVLLYLLNSGTIQNNDNVWEQARLLREGVPDTRLVFGTSSNQVENLSNLVRDPQNDVITLTLTSTGTQVDTTMSQVLSTIQMTGRRVVNPLCGANFAAGSSGVRQFDDSVEAGFINFYRVSPNYFYLNNDNARVRVSFGTAGVVQGSLTVCHSRSVILPRQNSTLEPDASAITCQNVVTATNVDMSLQNACNGFSTIGACPPLYFSVQANAVGETTTATCTDVNVCRFPNSIRYQIEVDGLGCFSNATNLLSSVFFVLFGLILNIVRSL